MPYEPPGLPPPLTADQLIAASALRLVAIVCVCAFLFSCIRGLVKTLRPDSDALIKGGSDDAPEELDAMFGAEDADEVDEVDQAVVDSEPPSRRLQEMKLDSRAAPATRLRAAADFD